MKNSLISFMKGMFAILTIKLLLFGAVFLNQACQKDDIKNLWSNSNKEATLRNFGHVLKQASLKSQTSIENEGDLLLSNSKSTSNVSSKIERSMKKELFPLVKISKELFKVYDIQESDISEEFEDLDDPRIALVGLMIYAAETKNNGLSFGFINLLASPIYAINKQWECVMEALGLPGGMIAGGMKKMTVKAMLKSVAKLAGRALGWVGLAWAVADYTSCMGYW